MRIPCSAESTVDVILLVDDMELEVDVILFIDDMELLLYPHL